MRRAGDRPVHSLDLPIDPRMVRFDEAVLDAVGPADHVEAHLPEPGRVAAARLLSELDPVVGQDGVDPARNGLQQPLQKLLGRLPVSLVDQLGDRELTGAVDRDEQVELAFAGLHLGKHPA